jgi:hypothetical protein
VPDGDKKELADCLPFGLNTVIKAPILDGASQRRLHHKLHSFGLGFVAHEAQHKSIDDTKQDA